MHASAGHRPPSVAAGWRHSGGATRHLGGVVAPRPHTARTVAASAPAAPAAAAPGGSGGGGFAAAAAPGSQRGWRRAAAKKRRQQQRRRMAQQVADADDDADDDDDAEGDDTGAAGADSELSELSSAQHVVTIPDFAPALCRQLRGVFDARFDDPRATSEERFLWDYFYVRNQYTMHRTQAGAYFPEALHEQLVDALLEYGEKQLGCRAISPIWMSYYIDGCVQELHCDSFHGPFAFVLSLTAPGKRWAERSFSGGETVILQPHVLHGFWSSFASGKGQELRDLVQLVPSPFGQLTVFDPRSPHGVRAVHGTRDPQQGRLVLHGWYTDPSPFFDGPLPERAALGALNAALEPMLEQLQALPRVLGTLSTRLVVSGSSGRVTRVQFLADTLVAPPAAAGEELGGGLLEPATIRGAVHHTVRDHLLAAAFPPCDGGDTTLTLPLVFD